MELTPMNHGHALANLLRRVAELEARLAIAEGTLAALQASRPMPGAETPWRYWPAPYVPSYLPATPPPGYVSPGWNPYTVSCGEVPQGNASTIAGTGVVDGIPSTLGGTVNDPLPPGPVEIKGEGSR